MNEDKLQKIFEGVYEVLKEVREMRSEIKEMNQRMERMEDNIELLGNKTGKHEMQIFHLQKSVERKGL